MDQPKFKVGDKVKTINDNMSGNIQSFSYDSDSGYIYKVTSKSYDAVKNEMEEGIMTCKENELEAFTGNTTPPKEAPTHAVEVNDTVTTDQPSSQ